MVPRVVLDTNVLVAGLRSRRGASHQVLGRRATGLRRSAAEIGAVLDYLCATGEHQPIHFLWRPLLPDPGDDLVLEVAVNGRCDRIITFNGRDFAGSERFGVTPISPREFLEQLGETP